VCVQEAEAEQRRHRKQLLEKYDLQVVGDASSKAGKGKAKLLQAWPSNKQEPKAAKVGQVYVLRQQVCPQGAIPYGLSCTA
jgi:hypothetical protein